MLISIASGKGGAGKTSVATSLAHVLGSRAQMVDCDVEEPNCHLLLKPEITESHEIGLPVPSVDMEKCSSCGLCGEICQFSAIVVIGSETLTFPEMCHGCGACSMLCPEKAITEVSRTLGVVETGAAGEIEFAHGKLRVGEAMSPPLIKAVRNKINPEKVAILDAPPGASCPVIATVNRTDYIILVSEPTPFGLNDLRIAVAAIRPLGVAMGVLINRSDIGDAAVKEYCKDEGIPVIMEIPHSERIARGYAGGDLLVESDPSLGPRFFELYEQIEAWVGAPSQTGLGAVS